MVYPKTNLVGQRFGKLLVKQVGEKNRWGTRWICQCDCGNTTNSPLTKSLLSGNARSCGCLRGNRKTVGWRGSYKTATHGLSDTRIYNYWTSLKQRCLNPNVKEYKNYGAKGIEIINEWKNFEPFYKWSINNGYKDDKYILIRFDEDGNYEPSNCVWVDPKSVEVVIKRSIIIKQA